MACQQVFRAGAFVELVLTLADITQQVGVTSRAGQGARFEFHFLLTSPSLTAASRAAQGGVAGSAVA